MAINLAMGLYTFTSAFRIYSRQHPTYLCRWSRWAMIEAGRSICYI